MERGQFCPRELSEKSHALDLSELLRLVSETQPRSIHFMLVML
jgi:hypothetical protein